MLRETDERLSCALADDGLVAASRGSYALPVPAIFVFLMLGATSTVVLLRRKWAPEVNDCGLDLQRGEGALAHIALCADALGSETRPMPRSR
ncbi:hypothetical protein PQQ53_04260 [Paraburkholderia strydomiana]|jgi:hypothetical protein|uniref:Uncharacterized protein n=1 Tax=Paraburkholderia strydomiana TaxID=1245417 RepID=A0ABW9EB54_9BURK